MCDLDWFSPKPVTKTDAMSMKLFLHTILLLHIYGFKGYLNRYKIDEMVNTLRIAVNSSVLKKSVLMLLKIICNI